MDYYKNVILVKWGIYCMIEELIFIINMIWFYVIFVNLFWICDLKVDFCGYFYGWWNGIGFVMGWVI